MTHTTNAVVVAGHNKGYNEDRVITKGIINFYFMFFFFWVTNKFF